MTRKRIPGRLLDQIYDAAVDGARWPDTLMSLAHFVGGEAGAAFCMEPATHRVLFNVNAGLDASALKTFHEHHQVNPWTRVMTRQPEGKLVLSDQIVPMPLFKRTEFYNEVLAPQRFGYNAMALLARREGSYMAFNLLRDERKGSFEPHEIASIRELLPHLHRALMLGFRVDGYRHLRDGGYTLLDRMAGGVILLDSNQAPIYANRAALLHDSMIRISRRTVALRNPGQQDRFSAALCRVFKGSPAETLLVNDANESKRTHLLICSVRGDEAMRLAVFGPGTVAAMIFMIDVTASESQPTQHALKKFALTAAEMRVAAAALRCDDYRAMAGQLNLSPNTIKTHLKRVYSKCGVNGRSQLFRLVSFSGLSNSPVGNTRINEFP